MVKHTGFGFRLPEPAWQVRRSDHQLGAASLDVVLTSQEVNGRQLKRNLRSIGCPTLGNGLSNFNVISGVRACV